MNSARFTIERLQELGVHSFINISINGIQSRFLIDTGASTTNIDSSFYEALGLLNAIVLDASISDFSGECEHVLMKTEIELSIGNGVWKCDNAIILPLTNINANYTQCGMPEIKGILGNDFFVETGAFIDYFFKIIYYK